MFIATSTLSARGWPSGQSHTRRAQSACAGQAAYDIPATIHQIVSGTIAQSINIIHRVIDIKLACRRDNPVTLDNILQLTCFVVDDNYSRLYPVSTNPLWPNLAGQKEQYFIKALQEYRDSARPDPTMGPLAQGLSDREIEDLAAYYASLPDRG